MVSKISDLEISFFLTPRMDAANNGLAPCFLSAAPSPALPLGRKQDWNDTSGNFTALGFAPQGQVYFSYSVFDLTNVPLAICNFPGDFGATVPSKVQVAATGDLNGDGLWSVIGKASPDSVYAEPLGDSLPGGITLTCSIGVVGGGRCPFGDDCSMVESYYATLLTAAPGESPRRSAPMASTWSPDNAPPPPGCAGG